MKVVENSPQNARNYTILKNFLGGSCPQTPIATARDMPALSPKNFKVGPPPPPLRNPAYAPVVNVVIIECLTQIMSYMHCIP